MDAGALDSAYSVCALVDILTCCQWRQANFLRQTEATMCSQWGFDAHLPRIFFISYGVTKTMQLALTRGLAETTAGTAV